MGNIIFHLWNIVKRNQIRTAKIQSYFLGLYFCGNYTIIAVNCDSDKNTEKTNVKNKLDKFDQLDKLDKFIRQCLKKWYPSASDTAAEQLLQFIKFGVVGVSNTLVSYFLNIAVLAILAPMRVSWDFVAGNVVSFVLSVLWSFYWNNRFVFVVGDGKKRSIWKTLLKTYVSYGFTGIFLNNMLSWLWIHMFGISKYLAPLPNLVISVPINFYINKLWAFQDEEQE